ncbi:unnamed protein product [Blepharisma stoltei]|uniref:Kinesin motor domain-containing protein n=1 Tax=Blepharisma stoltei TaxID=1481888 RepID=A0AAU9KC75_9CILI|nr:unnamed protein product [Blepharisma stoltei]
MKRLSSHDESSSNIKVIARFRPIIEIEADLPDNRTDLYTFPTDTAIEAHHDANNTDTFVYDKVFSPSSQQIEIFNFVGKPIIEDVLTGYNGTVFAYGQTGSGKSFTMMGLDIYDNITKGIIPRASSLIFESLSASTKDAVCTVKCSMLEIYKETLKDLLGGTGELKIKESTSKGIYIQGLTEEYVVCEEEMMEILSMGESNRTVASTKMNKVSSRSHQLFIVEVNQKLPDNSERRGVLNLVDLAGCEKINQTGVTGNKLEEAKKINLSLSALGNVIHALTSHSEHIPYRDSKLTRLLQESLGGNYKTTLIVNCSPHPRNYEDTLNTLKFAQRVKTIKNQAKLNVKKSPEAYMRIINKLKKEIEELKGELSRHSKSNLPSPAALKRKFSLTFEAASLENSGFFESNSGSLLSHDRFKSISDEVSTSDHLYEEFSSMKQDKENLESRNKELEEELGLERKKRIKAEEVSLRNYDLFQKATNSQNSQNCTQNKISAENESLKKQVEILQYHLSQINERFEEYITKINKGENITEWEFIDPSKASAAYSSDLPVYTEEAPLIVNRSSEIFIDIPLDAETLISQDVYSQSMPEVLEENSTIKDEIFIHQLRKQVIHSGLINCDLQRNYYELLWKFNLLKEKFNLKRKFVTYQEQKIINLEKSVEYLHDQSSKIIGLIDKLENGNWQRERASETPAGRGKIIRPIISSIETSIQRRSVRMLTTMPNHMHAEEPIAVRFNSEPVDESFKIRSLETSLRMQTLFNQQMRKGYELAKKESESYKTLLESTQKQTLEVYKNEKKRWKEYLEGFKNLCEKELSRKQTEINKLHEVLGSWITKYMELQEQTGIPCDKNKKGPKHAHKRTISKEYMVDLECLTRQTKIAIRPSKLDLSSSPFHMKFKKPRSVTVKCQSGDQSPPLELD